MCIFEHIASFYKDAELRAPSRSDGDGGGGSQSHCTRACDDEDDHGIDEGGFDPRTRNPPQGAGQQGDGEDDRDKDAGDAVGEVLYRCSGSLRLAHEIDDLRQDGICADLCCFEDKTTGHVARAACDFVSYLFVNR